MKRGNRAVVCFGASVACGLLISACASTGGYARPSPFPNAPRPPAASSTALATPVVTAPQVAALIATAISFRGTPYRMGGEDPRGFDCSGFVWYVFSLYQINVPRTVAEQFVVGTKASEKTIRAGDLLFFATTSHGPSHVAIALGNDEFIHAPSSTGVVRIEHLSTTYWHDRFLVAKRVF